MQRDKRLKPVLHLAQNKVDEAARALGYLNQKLAEETQLAQQLSQYEQEYLQLMRGGDAPQRAMDVQAVLRYQSFIQRLEQAQLQQQEQINLLNQQKAQVTAHWVKTRARARAIESAIEAAQAQQQVWQNRLEQKQQDEASVQRFAREMS